MTSFASFGRLAALLFLVPALFACAPDANQELTEDEILAHAQTIHEEAITIDTHNDILGNWGTPEIDPCAGTEMKVDIPKMVAGGLDMTFPAVFVGQGPRTPEGNEAVMEAALKKFTAIHRVAEEMCPEKVEIAYRADDVERILAEGKRVYGLGIENFIPIRYVCDSDGIVQDTYYEPLALHPVPDAWHYYNNGWEY